MTSLSSDGKATAQTSDISLAAAFNEKYGDATFTEEAYQALEAREKSELVWSLVERTRGQQGPATLGMAMVTSGFMVSHDFTMEHFGDELKTDRRKFIHQTGLIAQARFDTTGYEDHAFTGLFQGAEHCLVRCSLARRTAAGTSEKVTATPGIGIKFFRSGCHSGNVLAMYGVDGQHSWNFFRYPLRTAVEDATEFKTKLLGKAFAKSGTFPGRIGLSDMAARDELGMEPEDQVDFPFQLEFHPTPELCARFSDEFGADELAYVSEMGAMAGHEHIKSQLETLSSGDVVFEVRAWPDPWVADRAKLEGLSTEIDAMRKRDGGDTAKPATEGEAILSGATAPVTIGKLILTSDFVESSYADGKLFFKHQRYEEDLNLRPEWGCPAWYALAQNGANIANKLRAAKVSVEMKRHGKGTLIKEHHYHLRSYPDTLVGREAVSWMVENDFAANRGDAVLLGRLMVAAGALRHVARDHNFEDDYLFYCFDKRGHASMCPRKWMHPQGSICPMAGSKGAPVPHHHHHLVQRPDHSNYESIGSHNDNFISIDKAGEGRETKLAEDESQGALIEGETVSHLTVSSLHRTME